MKKIFKILMGILVVLVLIGILQFFNVIPKRCIVIYPTAPNASPFQLCVGVWEKEFWFPPMYL